MNAKIDKVRIIQHVRLVFGTPVLCRHNITMKSDRQKTDIHIYIRIFSESRLKHNAETLGIILACQLDVIHFGTGPLDQLPI